VREAITARAAETLPQLVFSLEWSRTILLSSELRPTKVILLAGPFVRERPGICMWRRNCPICRQPLEKKHPAETVSCPCGKFVWKG